MALPTPVQTIVKYSGEDASIITPAVGGSGDYSPAATGDFVPSGPVTIPVVGVWTDAKAAGLAQRFSGTFLIEAYALPAGLKPNRSNLLRAGQTYQIDSWRERVYLGLIDGYDLYVTR